jgi:phosphoserine phosphatase
VCEKPRFFETARHPVFRVPYTRLAYRPTRELIDLLWASGFSVYICSAGGRDFVRVVAEEMYGIPRERVIGSGTTLEYRGGEIFRTKGIEQPIDDGPGKPVHIWIRTGRKPLLAGGNADGDVAMLEAAWFALLIRHDDADREFAYDAGAEVAAVAAGRHGWTVVSMKDDFAEVF